MINVHHGERNGNQGLAELDEEEFYGQGFEQERVLLVWLGLTGNSDDDENVDVLYDLCGVGT